MSTEPRRVLIVDDEPAARAQLREVIGGMDTLEVVAEVSDGGAAITAIRDHAPDIVFLDIDMPGVDGFGVARATRDRMYQLVFVTAHHHYALEAFDTHAIDYLLKPARPSVIERCLEKILRQEVLTLEARTDRDEGSVAPRTLVLTDGGTKRVINPAQVLYIEGLGRYRRIHLDDEGAAAHRADTVLSDTTLDDFGDLLERNAFARVHRSYLVNMSRVTALVTRDRRQEIRLEGLERAIPVARQRVKALRSLLEK